MDPVAGADTQVVRPPAIYLEYGADRLGRGMSIVEYGMALGSMVEIVPSERMKSMSSGNTVFFIQKVNFASS